MERRTFINAALASAAGLALVSKAQAAEPAGMENVIFSDAQPGHWKGKQGTHVPVVEVSGDTIKVTTPHPMTEAHYIVSHSVVLPDGQLLGRKTFTSKDAPISTYTLPAGVKGPLTVTSTCNQHDWWIKTVTL
ncbi:desulfoferrodoxin [Parasulfuritortus cantonensis]|uniref:Desulfoferrodoxin n=1 Tax=Parasulfuritortus cantonensis TaxID=2528202 RepID=A0A4R1BM40_9PROT|nr:desulfoferrodoxin family protein [Parasulfuritortus cantonensis]TCJ18493.1 desulfoferrodoxin [Parasulfuritortus cantonensis]